MLSEYAPETSHPDLKSIFSLSRIMCNLFSLYPGLGRSLIVGMRMRDLVLKCLNMQIMLYSYPFRLRYTKYVKVVNYDCTNMGLHIYLKETKVLIFEREDPDQM